MEAGGAKAAASLRYAGGVKVTGQPLWFDPRERKAAAVLSSALSAPLIVHERTVLHTRLLDIHPRRNTRQAFLSAGYGEPVLLGDWDLTLLPSGFNPGASLIRFASRGREILYAGPFNPQSSRVAEDFAPAPSATLAVDLDWVSAEAHEQRRDQVATQVLQEVQASLDDGLMPVLFVPPCGIPEELALALGDEGPPILVHDAVMAGLQALRRDGFRLSERVRALKRSNVSPGHALMLPERMQGATPPRENQRLFCFARDPGEASAGPSPDHHVARRFPRFNEPDLAALEALVVACAPEEIVYVATRVDRWRDRAPRPEGVAVHFVEKEAQLGLL